MEVAANDGTKRARARSAGPRFAEERLSLARAADVMLGVLQDSQWANEEGTP